MRGDGLPYLDAPHVVLGRVSVHDAALENLSVEEAYVSDAAVLVGNDAIVSRGDNIVAVGLKPRVASGVVDTVALIEAHGLLHNLATCGHGLELDDGLRCFVLRDDDVLKVEVPVGAPHVLELEALDLNPLDELLVEGVERIECVHEVVLLAVRGRVVEHEERVEPLDALPRWQSPSFPFSVVRRR